METTGKIDGGSTVRAIGLFIGSLFLCSGIFTLFIHISLGNGFFKIISDFSVTVSLIIGILFTLTSKINKPIVKIMHVVSILGAGYLITSMSSLSLEIHGEFTIILGLMTMRIYKLVPKKRNYYVILGILSCFVIRFLSNYTAFISDIYQFVYYIILVLFFAVFFLLILQSEENKITIEASKICEQWNKEQVYNDIGRSVFSTFMHDYHIDHALVHLDTLEEFLDEGAIKESKIMIRELKELLKSDSDNILHIKEKIRLSEKDKPEIIDAYQIIEDRVRYYKKAYKLTDSELTTYYHREGNNDIYMVPIDFIGILDNLIKNAIEASPGLKSIKVLLYIDSVSGKVSVINKGKTIPWAESNGIVPLNSFRVGRTTKEKGSGWGVYSIIKRVHANSGNIYIVSVNGETDFTVDFPVKLCKEKILT